MTFSDLLNSPENRFINLFTPSFTSVGQEGPGKMSKLPAPSSGVRGPQVSRLAPPGSLTKRPREGSLDLETGLDAKKSKMEAPGAPVTNLAKSKSKSMMSIAGRAGPTGRTGTAGAGRGGVAATASKTRPVTTTRAGADRRQTTTALNDRTNSSVSR